MQESRFQQQSNVFFITSWGHAGDHWLSKALNAHPEIFVLNAHEGSRPKYFKDGLGRHQRPDLLQYTAFLEDMGTDYAAIGECHAYRASQMRPVQDKYQDRVPIINVLRHPHAWLDFYIRHRASNVRMPDGSSAALDHEWDHSQHALFATLDLHPYTRADVDVWAAYQGMLLLNQIIPDIESGVRQIRIEAILQHREVFQDMIDYLTQGRCQYDAALFDTVYAFAHRIYRGEETYVDAEACIQQWPQWKIDAFGKLVSQPAAELYAAQGYRL